MAPGSISLIREQLWANPDQILIGGQSRGGLWAVVYAGRRTEGVKGVINFVGGWMSERCVPDANGQFLSDAAKTAAVPMLWLYAE